MRNIKKKYKYQMGGMTDDQVDQAGIGVASSIPFLGPLWGALATAGVGASKSIAGDGTNLNKNIAAGYVDPFNQFKGNNTGRDWLQSFALPGTDVIRKAKDRKAKALEEQMVNRDRTNKAYRDYSNTVLQSYPSMGVEAAGYYAKYGGKIPSYLTNALAEGGEVIMSDVPPSTDNNGGVQPLASDVSKFYGDSHEAQSGGVGFQANSDSYIFSDSLRTSDGLTYAKQAEQIGRQKGKFEKKLQNATSDAEYNTAKRMIAKLDNKLSQLFNEQETLKQNGKI